MKNKFYSKLMSLALAFVLIASVAYAQDFNNTGVATYTTTLPSSNPILRMKASGGLITGIGDTYANRVVGTVVWGTGCSNPFEINPTGTGGDFYYTNMTVEGDADKTYDGDVFIAGNYTHSGTGETDHSTNLVTFTFNGETGTQTIAGENDGNGTGYLNLVLEGDAAKNIASGATAEVYGDFTQIAEVGGNLLTVDGTLSFPDAVTTSTIAFGDDLTIGATGTVDMGGSAATFDGIITNNNDFNFGLAALTFNGTIDNNGTFDATTGDANADATFNAAVTNNGLFNGGAGDLTFTDDFTNDAGAFGGGGFFTGDGPAQFVNFDQISGTLDVDAGEDILVSGLFDVTGGTIDLACTSNFTYNGTAAQVLTTTTVGGWAYGNLNVLGTGTITADGDVDVCNIFTANQEVDMYDAGADHVLTILNTGNTSDVVYNSDVEVLGSLKWTNIGNGTTKRFNNTNTLLTFGTAPTDFTMTVRPGTAPNVLLDTDTDINRKITGSFTGTGTITDIVLQWDATDESGFTGDRTKFRIGEGFNNAQPSQTVAIAGNVYDRTQTTISDNPRILSYTGSTGALALTSTGLAPAGTQEFFNGDDFVLTATPLQVISVVNGRWSDPQTWDIGTVPSPDDNALIKTIVWTGDERAQFGGRAWLDNELTEAITAITIGTEATPGNGSALIIGSEDDDMGAGEITFRTKLADNTNKITNSNTGAAGNGELLTGAVNGIWVRTASTFTPVLGTYLLENTGSVVNNSIIEVGVCQ